MEATMTREEMERAFYGRDRSYDGLFFVAVSTTGIFCRPSCPARKPKPENVTYFPSVREALSSGFRPCLRCRPMAADGRAPEWVDSLLGDVDASPDVRWTDALLRRRGLEPATVRRAFLDRYGMTFHAYARARRLGKALEAIRTGADLDDVILGHGFESHSGFREAFGRVFGGPPGKSRSAGCIRLAWLESPLGPMVAGANDEGACLLEFTDRRMLEAQFDALRRRFACAVLPGENAHLERLRGELAAYFAGDLRRFTVPMVYPGSPFQRRVWEALAEIPYGETRTYGQLAEAVGSRGASRAVGRANGLNRLAILLPCHRVVGADGALTGYGGGLWRKRRLLELERASITRWP